MNKNILVVGASGFIGSHVASYLIFKGFSVKCAVRDVENLKLKFKDIEIFKLDFNQEVPLSIWEIYLKDTDIVINAAGILNNSKTNDIEKVHNNGPVSMVNACKNFGVKRIIHISALGIDNEYTTDYSNTKKQFDNFLTAQTDLDWVIFKPSLIYANNSSTGTTLLRGLASLPLFIPIIGEGDQKFQPVHMDDLTKIIEYCAVHEGSIKQIFDVAGPDVLEIKSILAKFRNWMGLSDAVFIKIPLFIIENIVKIPGLFGNGPLSKTSIKMMQKPNIGNIKPLTEFTSIIPRSFDMGLNSITLNVQSLWHARFSFIEPVISFVFALFWIYTGAMTIFNIPVNFLTQVGYLISPQLSLILIQYFSFTNIVIGSMMLTRRYRKISYLLQIFLICLYSVVLSIIDIRYWLDPLGSLSKNIPILMLTIILFLLDKRR